MKKILFLLVVFPVFFISCGDNDDNKDPGFRNLPSKIITAYDGIEGEDHIYISYYGKFITGIKKTNASGDLLSYEVKIHYVSEKPVRATVNYGRTSSMASHTIDFTYSEEHITATYSTGGIFYITADGDGKITGIDTKQVKTTFEYDAKGNIINIGNYATLVYDSSPGIFSQTETPQWLLVACLGNYIIPYCTANNRVEWYSDTEGDSRLRESLEFSYNKDGYPESATGRLGNSVEGYPQHIKSIEYI